MTDNDRAKRDDPANWRISPYDHTKVISGFEMDDDSTATFLVFQAVSPELAKKLIDKFKQP